MNYKIEKVEQTLPPTFPNVNSASSVGPAATFSNNFTLNMIETAVPTNTASLGSATTNDNFPVFDTKRFALVFLIFALAIVVALIVITQWKRIIRNLPYSHTELEKSQRQTIVIGPNTAALRKSQSLPIARTPLPKSRIPLRIDTSSPKIDTLISQSPLLSPDHLKDDQLLALSTPTNSFGLSETKYRYSGTTGYKHHSKKTFSTLSQTEYHLIQVDNEDLTPSDSFSNLDLVYPDESASQVIYNDIAELRSDV